MSRNSAKIFCDAVGITLEELEKDHKFTLTTSRKTYGKRKRNLQVLMAAKTFGLGVSDQELRPVHNALKVLRPFLAMLTPQQFELMVHVAKLYVPPNEKNTVAT